MRGNIILSDLQWYVESRERSALVGLLGVRLLCALCEVKVKKVKVGGAVCVCVFVSALLKFNSTTTTTVCVY